MNLIVAVDENWNIGYKNDLLEKISADLKNFKRLTLNSTVIMGRNTFDSLPGKKALPKRINIVLSRDKNLHIPNVIICNTIQEALHKISDSDQDKVFVIGGETIYKHFLPYCEKAYITKIFNKYIADKKMINLDLLSEWKIIEKSEIFENDNGIKFQYITYKRL
ncbi:MAG: dihydrofolate reductase [Candidatus Cloacimonetes bacterium]|jgi:dihydrofolate reductase|nr:dihydrofolate reductase [Candidatus Cloacimonadota bacterium]